MYILLTMASILLMVMVMVTTRDTLAGTGPHALAGCSVLVAEGQFKAISPCNMVFLSLVYVLPKCMSTRFPPREGVPP